MTDRQDQQLFQIQNILETLLEATDHFAALLEKKELKQSVDAFTSILEGMEAIASPLTALDPHFHNKLKKIETEMIKIAGHLEENRLDLIPSILESALMPLFSDLLETFKHKFGEQE